MAYHTPGPWKYGQRGPSDNVVAHVEYWLVYAEEKVEEGADEVNACLISAAPDLFDACEKAQRVMNDYGNAADWPPDMPMEYAETINELRAALAKAEGYDLAH